VALEILDCLREHHVQRVIALDRISGCPHEEGVDHPEGTACPECPYWQL
jgi:hypothetical protein